VTIPHLN